VENGEPRWRTELTRAHHKARLRPRARACPKRGFAAERLQYHELAISIDECRLSSSPILTRLIYFKPLHVIVFK
jgi:hypothetical protein